MHTERRRIIQKESEERSKELYNQFFFPLFESLCNEQVYSSLIDQLVSMSLISEADKETWLSSTQHPKVRTTSLLEVLNIEEKPHLLMELIKAMEEVEELKGLADEMLTQHRANEGVVHFEQCVCVRVCVWCVLNCTLFVLCVCARACACVCVWCVLNYTLFVLSTISSW